MTKNINRWVRSVSGPNHRWVRDEVIVNVVFGALVVLLAGWVYRINRRVRLVGGGDSTTALDMNACIRLAEQARELALATHERIDAHQKAINLVYGDAWARARSEVDDDV